MVFETNTAQLMSEAERAQEDSLTLWRSLKLPRTAWDASDKVSLTPYAAERCPLNLKGRYRVGDGNEFLGEITEVSALGLRIKGPKSGRIGDWCTASIATVGVIEGLVIEARQHSFVVSVIATPRRLKRLAQRLNWHFRREKEEVTDRRSSERIEMNHAKALIETSERQVYPCEIFDLSEGGAALHLGASALYFWIDQAVKLDGRAGRVLRCFPGGVVVKFD
jgi:hypothetical protein